MNESQLKQSSTSSEKTVNSEHSDAIVTLGRKLVHELGLEPSCDTLGRWMSHHLAELITKCEREEDGEAKESAKKECFNAILTLWRHRSELPNGKRPFEDMEPIVRAVASLDPEDETPRYLRAIRPHQGNYTEESKVESWLELAYGLDYSAKLLIGHCLTQAASSATEKSEEWIKLANKADLDDGPSEIVFELVNSGEEFDTDPNRNQILCEKLVSRLTKLRAFVNMAEELVEDLELRLSVIGQSSARSPEQ